MYSNKSNTEKQTQINNINNIQKAVVLTALKYIQDPEIWISTATKYNKIQKLEMSRFCWLNLVATELDREKIEKAAQVIGQADHDLKLYRCKADHKIEEQYEDDGQEQDYLLDQI
mgnify:CR=1 FL=1|tara:strand:- start:243 stop:587 length:345 start_codon:yes stop_codon:yes gene_type:complete